MLRTIITKIDHDEYYGYYINDKLYRYTEYYNVNDKQVELEAIVQAFEQGLIHQRNHLDIVFVEKYDLPGYSSEADNHLIKMTGNLPDSCEALKAFYANFKK
jgi:hypothetical protein